VTGQSQGHESVRLIAETLDKNSSDYADHKRCEVGYVHRHLAQKPSGGVEGSTWRYSLLNSGHETPSSSVPPLEAGVELAPV
jgi:hypothetical protein